MSRAIKFRVWDKTKNEFTDPTISYTNGQWYSFGHTFLLEEKGLVLQQFTGLLDSNNKEIYEGDIIKAGAVKGIINFADSAFFVGDELLFNANVLLAGNLKIIGNMFETPELLK